MAGETDVLLDASSLTAAGSSDRPPINPRTVMIGAKPKSMPTSNKISGKNLPSEKPTSKSKAAPRTHSKLRSTPSTSCAVAWERVIDHGGPTQRRVFRRNYSQNSMIDGMFPEWPAGLTSAQFLKYASKWMQAAGLKGTNTVPKIKVPPFNAWSESPRRQIEYLAIVILDTYLFQSMPETGQWYKMYDGKRCSESELVIVSRALTWYTRVVGSNSKDAWKSGGQ